MSNSQTQRKMKKVSKAAVREAVKWINEQLLARGLNGDWRGAIQVWDNGAITARLKFGEIDTNPRPAKTIRGEVFGATIIASDTVHHPNMVSSLRVNVEWITEHLNQTVELNAVETEDDGVPF